MNSAIKPQGGIGPIVALLILSPLLGEVMFGAIRISAVGIFPLLIGTWGCAALMIRYLIKIKPRFWAAGLFLGLALAVAEECVIQQTSLAPLIGSDLSRPYGRNFGVNWHYLLWALGYEALWVIWIPIRLTELLFPGRREDPWIGRRGFIIATAVFGIFSLGAWYSWTRQFVPRYFPQYVYRPPTGAILISLLAITALVYLGLKSPRESPGKAGVGLKAAPGLWKVGLTAFCWGLPWCGLVLVAYGAVPGLPPALSLVQGLVLAACGLLLFRRWKESGGWNTRHELAFIQGALLASMVVGFALLRLAQVPWISIDIIGKLVLNLFAIKFLFKLGKLTALNQDR